MPEMWTDRMLYDACHKTGSEQTEAFEILLRELYCITFYMAVTHSKYPDPESLAEDCAQGAIIRIWESLDTCQKPDSFRAWAREVARNQTLNELKKANRIYFHERIEEEGDDQQRATTPSPPEEIEQKERFIKMMNELAMAPWSPLSKQVVLGKLLEDKKDIKLAEELSQSEGRPMRPSHIQVIRTKDLNKLRGDDGLSALLRDLRE